MLIIIRDSHRFFSECSSVPEVVWGVIPRSWQLLHSRMTDIGDRNFLFLSITILSCNYLNFLSPFFLTSIPHSKVSKNILCKCVQAPKISLWLEFLNSIQFISIQQVSVVTKSDQDTLNYQESTGMRDKNVTWFLEFTL